MIAFIVPLKSAKHADSWAETLENCKSTVKSILKNKGNYCIYIVCNEKPPWGEGIKKLNSISMKYRSRKDRPRVDISNKLKRGLVEAGKDGASHAMRVDSDDYVSKSLVKFVSKSGQKCSWCINKGYFWKRGKKYVIKNFKFHKYCGTSNIVKFEKDEFPKSMSDDEFLSSFSLHDVVSKKLKRKGKNVQFLPFPGAVYHLGDHESVSSNENLGIVKKRDVLNPKRLAWKIAGLRPLTKRIKEEFNIDE